MRETKIRGRLWDRCLNKLEGDSQGHIEINTLILVVLFSLAVTYAIFTKKRLFSQFHMRKLVDIDFEHRSNLLSKLQVHKRLAISFDFLGTALKIVAVSGFEKIKWSE